MKWTGQQLFQMWMDAGLARASAPYWGLLTHDERERWNHLADQMNK